MEMLSIILAQVLCSVCYFEGDGNRGTGVQPSQPHPREKFLVTESPFKQNLR